jgi:hypothetical protein
MSTSLLDDPRMRAAIDELQGLIRSRYPEATFSTELGEGGEAVFIWTTVDVLDTDEVMDLCVDRVVDLIVEEGVPVHVIPVPTPEKSEQIRRELAQPGSGHGLLRVATG